MVNPSGLPEGAIALAIVAQLGLVRVLCRADEASVYVVGVPWRAVCAARARFGVPCPMCGATRSLVLTVHGEIGLAWQLFPAGPLAVAGLCAFAIALAVLSWLVRRGARARALALRRAMAVACAAYAGAAFLVWMVDWVARCRSA